VGHLANTTEERPRQFAALRKMRNKKGYFLETTAGLENERYDTTARLGKKSVKISDGSDMAAMEEKFEPWTSTNVNLYFETLQNYTNVLDLGASYGFFMREIQKQPNSNFQIEGIEIGKVHLDNFIGGRAVHNLNILTQDIPPNLRHKYDCVISMHLLEHISNPVLFLEKVKGLLKPHGDVIFEVPNLNCLLGKLCPEYKDFMYLYELCSYYTAETLRLAFEKAGYTIHEIATHEVFSIENHLHWIRNKVPYTKHHLLYMPDERLEWINEIYKKEIGKQGKGFVLTVKATPK